MEEKYIPKIWHDKVIEQLDKTKMLELEFIPKYKGDNKVVRWICFKLKIGDVVRKYPNYYSDLLKEGTRIRIKKT